MRNKINQIRVKMKDFRNKQIIQTNTANMNKLKAQIMIKYTNIVYKASQIKT